MTHSNDPVHLTPNNFDCFSPIVCDTCSEVIALDGSRECMDCLKERAESCIHCNGTGVDRTEPGFEADCDECAMVRQEIKDYTT